MHMKFSAPVSGSDHDMLPAGKPMRILLSSVSSDSHTWNLVFLQLFLEFKGHEVRNLGGCTPDSEILSACEEMAPDLLVISSVNGHGNIDGERLIRKLRQNDFLVDLPVAIGGKLGIPSERPRWFTQVGSGTPGTVSRFTLDAMAIAESIFNDGKGIMASTNSMAEAL